jgi:hypothetical protein
LHTGKKRDIDTFPENIQGKPLAISFNEVGRGLCRGEMVRGTI